MRDRGPLLCETGQKAELEARNGALQLEYITQLVEGGAKYLRESHVLQLQKIAVDDIYPCAGKYRDAYKRVVITNTDHAVPESALVPSLVRDAVDWINDERNDHPCSALDRAAYALWRFNWIHPFAGGNGRTSRAVAYMILCMDRGFMLPGLPTMPTLIYDHRDEYITALRAVDASVSGDAGKPAELDAMSNFLRRMLVRQLASVVDDLAKPRK